MSFNVGDVVMLKSGGPLMTISFVKDGNTGPVYETIWFNRSGDFLWERKIESFPEKSLKLASS